MASKATRRDKVDNTAIYTMVTLAGLLIARASLTDAQATVRNAALTAAKSSFRWVAA